MGFDVLLDDGTTRRIDGVDSYEADGPMTTFFTAHGRHRSLSAWSERVASIRTTKVVWIHRVEERSLTTTS